jgi:hypothetical protein
MPPALPEVSDFINRAGKISRRKGSLVLMCKISFLNNIRKLLLS